MIASLSKPDTMFRLISIAVPFDFHDKLMEYTKHGYRVIALAWKPLPEKLNYVKVQKLQSFATGDNMLTAVSVARECGMVNHSEDIVLVQAFPPDGASDAYVEFIYTEDKKERMKEIRKSFEKDHSLIEIEDARYSTNNMYFALSGQSWDTLRQHFPETLRKVS
ncbi:hypothetical protein KUTeg_002379 [Tegillarca granosa]|uniref:Uncharacterized protein n=1 Tax=Tegillarca granosa TaxID=220873 RepID=A0ABQ9FVG5_TEGGR|nr:hypothetical protein KUTeg_002379 [Tegillarca granosa]